VPDEGPRAQDLLGRAAIANAKRAYRSFQRIFSGERWEEREADGARPQRVLWASTSTKDPLYSDVKYVEPLIGPDTVNTLPERTIAAFADHGRVEETVADGMEESREVMEQLAEAGVDFAHVTAQLENEGVQKFIDPYDRLMAKLAERVADAPGDDGATQSIALADDVALDDALSSLNQRRFGERLFGRDGSLWSRDPGVREAIGRRLGWLEAPDQFREAVEEIRTFADGIRPPEFTRVVVLGMGGSSECARTCAALFGPGEGRPELRVLDDTAPAAIRRMDREIDPSRTLFVVASKSGTTVETLSLYRHYRQLVAGAVDGDAGDRFVAITDPGTPLAREAEEGTFRRRFLNPEDVGGRFSALTYFGLVPMALLGVDVSRILAGASRMLRRCGAPVPAGSNPAVRLGVALGLLAESGRDKVTLLPSRELRPLGGWLRQLLRRAPGRRAEDSSPWQHGRSAPLTPTATTASSCRSGAPGARTST
jgi:transaldolase/glucose-6-phosphate isomerase